MADRTLRAVPALSATLDLDALERAVPDLGAVPLDQVPRVLSTLALVQARIAALQAAIVTRAMDSATVRQVGPVPDRLLSAREAAAVLGVSEDWIRTHERDMPAVRNGRRVGYSEQGLQAYIRAQAGKGR